MEISKEGISSWLVKLQNDICDDLGKLDGGQDFNTDRWERKQGGGGITRTISNGKLIEKGGVLYSAVWGVAPQMLISETGISSKNDTPAFYATGVSIVLHPVNPHVPIIHMNIRYFEAGNKKWLGGGIDLTPHYVDVSTAENFHSSLKNICDRYHPVYYPEFKKWADDYFYLPHRNETRGIGGIFFDKLCDDRLSFEKNLSFWRDVGAAFTGIYAKATETGRSLTYTSEHKRWQRLRRGRYVEFNLLYDKGTKFGLESNGRVESILMSMPPLAGWEYDKVPAEDSEESKTLALLRKGINWVN